LNSVVKWGGTVKGIEFYAKSGAYQFHVSWPSWPNLIKKDAWYACYYI
jgi:hypothetical protein